MNSDDDKQNKLAGENHPYATQGILFNLKIRHSFNFAATLLSATAENNNCTRLV